MKPGYRKKRRANAMKRLEAQLASKRKVVDPIEKGYFYEDLSDKDIERIKKEMLTLKSRI